MVIITQKLFIMNMKDHCAPNAIFQWTVMVLGQPKLTNGRSIRKKTVHLPRIWKNTFHKFGKFHKKIYSNYTHAICEKSLEYESITYLSLSKEGRNN